MTPFRHALLRYGFPRFATPMFGPDLVVGPETLGEALAFAGYATDVEGVGARDGGGAFDALLAANVMLLVDLGTTKAQP